MPRYRIVDISDYSLFEDAEHIRNELHVRIRLQGEVAREGSVLEAVTLDTLRGGGLNYDD